MIKKYILALDEGTTSARAILFDKDFNIKMLNFGHLFFWVVNNVQNSLWKWDF